jgi:hypothetical protein
MSLPDFIEIHDDPPAFNEADWIGKGRQYPKAAAAPLALANYVENLQVVPDTVNKLHSKETAKRIL